MRQVQSLNHTRWECKYHIVFITKYAVLQVVGFIEGKGAIHIARVHAGRRRNFVGQHFWGCGYFASTVGRDEQVIRDYIRHQKAEDRRLEQLSLV